MSIEKNLEALATNTGRIADALEKLLSTTAITSTITVEAPAVEEPKKPAARAAAKKVEPKVVEPEPEHEPEVEEQAEEPAIDPLDDDKPPFDEATFTPDEVRAALRTYRDVEGDGAMMAVLKSFGATGMGSLKEADYAAVMAKVR